MIREFMNQREAWFICWCMRNPQFFFYFVKTTRFPWNLVHKKGDLKLSLLFILRVNFSSFRARGPSSPAHAILLAFILLRPFWFVWRTDQVVYCWSSLEVCDELFSFWIIKPSIEYLIFLSAINNGDKSGKTPLHTAILSKQFKIVDRLLECGADVTRKDDAGDTALHTAIRVGSERLVLVSINNNVQWYSYLSHEPPWNVLSNRQTLSIRVSNFSRNILEEILSLIRFCIRYSMHSVVSK